MKDKLFFRRLFPYKNVPIISYHGISNNLSEKPVFLQYPSKRFIKQMNYLYKGGFSTVHLDEVINLYKSYHLIKGKPIAISFDDGLRETYTTAFPILLKYNLSATVFLVTKFIGKKIVWGQNSPVEYLSWDQCKEMARYGISFQSHTCTHPDLTTLKRNEAWNELHKSKMIIEDKLGNPVQHLAYPFGRYNSLIRNLVKDVGYEAAYASVRSECIDRKYCMERFPIAFGLKSTLFRFETSVWGSWLRNLYHTLFFMFRAK